MTPLDPVREFLRERGAPDHMVEGGLDGLLDYWDTVVEDVTMEYPLGLDDYLNDMDTRELIEGAIEVAPPRERAAALSRVQETDGRLREMVEPAGRCLWGEDMEREEGWSAETNWWYYNKPRHPGPDLKEDLEQQ